MRVEPPCMQSGCSLNVRRGQPIALMREIGEVELEISCGGYLAILRQSALREQNTWRDGKLSKRPRAHMREFVSTAEPEETNA